MSGRPSTKTGPTSVGRTGTIGCPHVRSRELGIAVVRDRPVRTAREPRTPRACLLVGVQPNVVVGELEHYAHSLSLERVVRGDVEVDGRAVHSPGERSHFDDRLARPRLAVRPGDCANPNAGQPVTEKILRGWLAVGQRRASGHEDLSTTFRYMHLSPSARSPRSVCSTGAVGQFLEK